LIIQENRSFDNLFNGFPGANTVQSGLNSNGDTIQLEALPLSVPFDIGHGLSAFQNAWDQGAMDGFNREQIIFYQPPPSGYKLPRNPQYHFVDTADVKPYIHMAKRYVLADEMFASQLDASFAAHQYLISGQADKAVNVPSGEWGCDGGPKDYVSTLTHARKIGPSEHPCFDAPTIGSELDTAGIGWRYYAPAVGDSGYFWSAYDAISSIRQGSEWSQRVFSPPSKFLTDIKAGNLQPMTWIVPEFADSDHAGGTSKRGPDWVASVVNAIGSSKFWPDCAIFIVWDDWGGWYDHVPPPQLDFDGLGMRVPMIVVSPYAHTGVVTHTQYEFGSILKFIEATFGIPALAASDSRATMPGSDIFHFSTSGRRFTTIPTTLNASDFEHEPASHELPDRE
jgi:phospholipase C